MEVLITSKTHKGKAACVGGLLINNNRLVRLLNPGNWDQFANTDFDIGDVWDITFQERDDVEPPHIEDIIILSKKYVSNIGDISQFLQKSGVTIYNGSPNQIFDGLLDWTGNGGGYLSQGKLPDNSVGFWISDSDLILDEDDKHYVYKTNDIFERDKRIAYVGFAPKVKVIPSGTLMRVSLARWWKPEDSTIEERCYLQLSGWYGVEEKM